jgi:hypothetical protein
MPREAANTLETTSSNLTPDVDLDGATQVTLQNWRSARIELLRLLQRSTVRTTTDDLDSVASDLRRKLGDALSWAKFVQAGSDDDLKSAHRHARTLIESGLFSDGLYPQVSVDMNGEFCFTMRRPGGYVDIGVDGENTLSYHVRNDDKGESTHDDIKFLGIVPSELRDALSEM